MIKILCYIYFHRCFEHYFLKGGNTRIILNVGSKTTLGSAFVFGARLEQEFGSGQRKADFADMKWRSIKNDYSFWFLKKKIF